MIGGFKGMAIQKRMGFFIQFNFGAMFQIFSHLPLFLQNGLAVQFSAICRGTYQLHSYILKERPIPFRSCMETHSSTFTRLQNKGRNYMLKGRHYNFYEHGRIFLHIISKFCNHFTEHFTKCQFCMAVRKYVIKVSIFFFSILLG